MPGIAKKKILRCKTKTVKTKFELEQANFTCLYCQILQNISFGKKRVSLWEKKLFLTTDLSNWHDFLVSFRRFCNCFISLDHILKTTKLPHSLFCYTLSCLAWISISILLILSPEKKYVKVISLYISIRFIIEIKRS